MKKVIFCISIWLSLAFATYAQVFPVKGIVNDQQGNAVHFVFVTDHKSGTYTDSLGNFTIVASNGSQLKFNSQGYKDTTLTISNNSTIRVILKTLGVGSPAVELSTLSQLSTQPVSRGLTDGDMATLSTGGGSLPALGHQKGNVKGNRYMFNTFVPGFVVNSNGSLIENPNYFFDYDKMAGQFLLTADKKSITAVNDMAIKTITLFSADDKLYAFEIIPSIDNAHYSQVLASGKKYSIYKSINTKFIRSNYVNNGVTSHGNDYDEFVDDNKYYVFDVQTNKLSPFNLKKKALKAAFPNDTDKLTKFITDHSADDLNDNYLRMLGDYLNN